LGISSGGWSTQQLAEFLDSVSAVSSARDAIERAVEGAAEALDAEIAAIVEGSVLVASVGYPRGQAPDARLAAVTGAHEQPIELPGLGAGVSMAVPIGE